MYTGVPHTDYVLSLLFYIKEDPRLYSLNFNFSSGENLSNINGSLKNLEKPKSTNLICPLC
jgi:hypothetical protein